MGRVKRIAARDDVAFAAIFGVAVLVRLAFIRFCPLSGSINWSYVNPARDLLGGRFGGDASIHRLPGAALFFALCLAVLRDYRAVVVFQHVLGLLNIQLAIGFARRAWGRRAGLCAGVLFALQFASGLQEHYLQSETLCQFLFLLALWLALRLRREPASGPSRWALAGACAGAAALTRGEFLPLGPIIAAALLIPRRPASGAPSRLGRGLVYLGSWTLLLGAWTVRNWADFHYKGFYPDGQAVWMDMMLPAVRYDLPSEPVAKQVLREATLRTADPTLNPRVVAEERLQAEYGYTWMRSERAMGAIAREAALTQPRAYLSLAAQNLSWNLLPKRWLDKPGISPDGRPPALDARGRWGVLLHRALSWDQAWGWLELLSAALALLVMLASPPEERWAAGLLWAVFFWLWGGLSAITAASLRIQTELYVPLGLLGAYGLGRFRAAPRGRPRSPKTGKASLIPLLATCGALAIAAPLCFPADASPTTPALERVRIPVAEADFWFSQSKAAQDRGRPRLALGCAAVGHWLADGEANAIREAGLWDGLGRPKKGLAVLSAFSADGSASPALLLVRAKLALSAGDKTLAQASLDALPLERCSDDQLQDAARIEQDLGAPQRSLPLFSRLIAKNPSAGLFQDRAVCESLMGRERQAREDARQALRLDPRLATAYLTLGALLQKSGRFSQAAALYDRGLRMPAGRPDEGGLLPLLAAARDAAASSAR